LFRRTLLEIMLQLEKQTTLVSARGQRVEKHEKESSEAVQGLTLQSTIVRLRTVAPYGDVRRKDFSRARFRAGGTEKKKKGQWPVDEPVGGDELGARDQAVRRSGSHDDRGKRRSAKTEKKNAAPCIKGDFPRRNRQAATLLHQG